MPKLAKSLQTQQLVKTKQKVHVPKSIPYAVIPIHQRKGGDKNQPGTSTTPRPPSAAQRAQWFPFSRDTPQRILLVGEGNFSFAAALLSQVQGTCACLIATAFDDATTTHQKYPDAERHIDMCKDLGGQIHFGIDATRLGSGGSPFRSGVVLPFHRIVFNFPHCGRGIKDRERNIIKNQELLLVFFESAQTLLVVQNEGGLDEMGLIVVTLKQGDPYDEWDVKGLAKQAGLVSKGSFPFLPELYPGYAHRRTIGFQEGISAGENEEVIARSKTYLFGLPLGRD